MKYFILCIVNVDGVVYPCSFMEGEGEWKSGISLLNEENVWNHPRVLEWREKAIKCIECKGCNECPYYEV